MQSSNFDAQGISNELHINLASLWASLKDLRCMKNDVDSKYVVIIAIGRSENSEGGIVMC